MALIYGSVTDYFTEKKGLLGLIILENFFGSKNKGKTQDRALRLWSAAYEAFANGFSNAIPEATEQLQKKQ